MLKLTRLCNLRDLARGPPSRDRKLAVKILAFDKQRGNSPYDPRLCMASVDMSPMHEKETKKRKVTLTRELTLFRVCNGARGVRPVILWNRHNVFPLVPFGKQ